jgi:hypothetical protein
MLGWLWFAVVQTVTVVFNLLGLVLLIPFCLELAWEPCPSRFNSDHLIDRWRFGPLNWVYSNPEDGVSGEHSLVHAGPNGTGARVPYMPGANPAWRAYCWSALRNSADNLKYVFAWSKGPFKRGTWLGGREWKVGWQTENGVQVPVLSL